MLTIRISDKIEKPLYQGPLELGPEGFSLALKGARDGLRERDLPKSGPVVTLGTPQSWNLVELAIEREESLPAEVRMLLKEAHFHLVVFACSFRPDRRSAIRWARFSVSMTQISGQDAPVAFDLYPREIYVERKTDLAVAISPSLKFAETELSLGEAIANLEFRKLEPRIVGSGVLESSPSWDFEQLRERPLRGSRQCCLIVKKPLRSQGVHVSIGLVADVVTRNGLFSMRISDEARAAAEIIVCRD